MTSSNGTIFHITGPLCGEFTGPGEFPAQRPVTRSFDVFFDVRLNKQLSKQPWGRWFEMPPWSLWRHCNVHGCLIHSQENTLDHPASHNWKRITGLMFLVSKRLISYNIIDICIYVYIWNLIIQVISMFFGNYQVWFKFSQLCLPCYFS